MGNYKKKIEEELYKNCDEIISIIKADVLAGANESEAKAFFLKMIGDYCRYIAESAKGDRLEKTKQDALKSYSEACGIAEKDLGACNSIRLGLALNFSVFHYEVMNEPTKACTLAKQAFDEAIADIEHLDEDQYKDSTTIMQLIRDNLTLWTSELQEQGDEKGENA